ncbi:MAG: hypothetical protein Q4D31_00640 [Eubacteriales bacterium]|nr:hypothetical protein [Eubacteriales bacterium]
MKERIGDIWRRYRARCCGIGSALLIVWTVIGGWGAAAEEEPCLCDGATPLQLTEGDKIQYLEGGVYYLPESMPKLDRQLMVDGGQNVTLCLHGHGWEIEQNHSIAVAGTLTICDCGGTGHIIKDRESLTLKTSDAKEKYAAIRVMEGGTLIVKSGTLECAGGAVVSVDKNGSVIIEDGKLSSFQTDSKKAYHARTIALYGEGSHCTIKGGEVYSYGHAAVYAATNSTIEISGGEVAQPVTENTTIAKVNGQGVEVYPKTDNTVIELNGGQLVLSGTPTFKKGDDSPTIRVAQLSDSVENAPLALSLDGTPYTGYPLQVKVEKWDGQYLAKDVPKECADKLQSTPTIYYNDKDNTFGSKDPSIHDSHSPGGGLQPIDYKEWPTEEGWPEGNALNDGNYYLAGDVGLSESIKITGTVNICLNGYTISSTDESCFIIESGGSLTVCDHGDGAIVSKASSETTDKSIFAAIENHGTLTLYSGAACGDWIGVRDYKT